LALLNTTMLPSLNLSPTRYGRMQLMCQAARQSFEVPNFRPTMKITFGASGSP